MNGKSKCKILKDIRRQIAQENDIAFITSECKYQGDCSGTCPKCEAEVRYLEEELRKRQKAGKAVAVAGIAAALVVAASGCAPSQTGGDPLPESTSTTMMKTDPTDPIYILPGAVIAPESTPPETALMGDMLVPEETGSAENGD